MRANLNAINSTWTDHQGVRGGNQDLGRIRHVNRVLPPRLVDAVWLLGIERASTILEWAREVEVI